MSDIGKNDAENNTGAEYADDEPAMLCTCQDGGEAAVIMSLLQSRGIPSMKNYKGIGDSVAIYMGMARPALTVDIYVPSRLLALAQETLSAESGLDGGEPDAADWEGEAESPISGWDQGQGQDEDRGAGPDEDEKDSTRRRRGGWILLLVFVIPVAGVIIAEIIRLMMG